MKDKKKVLLADIALIIAAIFWGGGFIATDIASEFFTPYTIMSVRFTVAAIVIFLLFSRVIKRCGKKEMLYGGILGGMLFLAHPIQIIALGYTTPSKQAFLIASYATMVPFLCWILFKQRPKIKTFIAGILVFIGIGIISLDGAFQIQFGDALSLVFAVAYAFIVIYTGIFAGKCNPLGMTLYSFLTTAVLSIIMAVIFEEPPSQVPMEGIYALAYLAFGNTAVAYTLQNIAQKYTSSTHASILISTESIFAFVFGVFLFGDPFTIKVLIGGLVVFTAVLISELKLKEDKEVHEEIEPPKVIELEEDNNI